MSIGSTFAPLFTQVGILDDLKEIGKLNIGLEFLNPDLTTAFNLDTSEREEMYANLSFFFFSIWVKLPQGNNFVLCFSIFTIIYFTEAVPKNT